MSTFLFLVWSKCLTLLIVTDFHESPIECSVSKCRWIEAENKVIKREWWESRGEMLMAWLCGCRGQRGAGCTQAQVITLPSLFSSLCSFLLVPAQRKATSHLSLPALPAPLCHPSAPAFFSLLLSSLQRWSYSFLGFFAIVTKAGIPITLSFNVFISTVYMYFHKDLCF